MDPALDSPPRSGLEFSRRKWVMWVVPGRGFGEKMDLARGGGGGSPLPPSWGSYDGDRLHDLLGQGSPPSQG